MRQILMAIFPLLTLIAGAQQTVDVGRQDVRVTNSMFYTVGGSPFSSTKYVRLVEGSPYFKDEWTEGSVESAEGIVYSHLRLKLDLIDHSVLFLGHDSVEMIATIPIRRIVFNNPDDSLGYRFVSAASLNVSAGLEKGWYQELRTGNISLYKFIYKKINETKPYNSATYEQSVISTDRYLLIRDGQPQWIKKFRDIPVMLGSKVAETTAFIANNKLSGRRETDYSSVIGYFNQITTGNQPANP